MRSVIQAGEVIALVSYIRKRLRNSEHPELTLWASRRTAIQKIAYFALLPGERNALYEPYLYGPYSDAIQGAVIGLERRDFFEETAEKCPDSWKKAVDRVLETLCKHCIYKLQDLVFLSKVHYLRNLMDPQANTASTVNDSQLIPEIKQKAKILGWKEVSDASPEKLKQMIRLAQEIAAQFP